MLQSVVRVALCILLFVLCILLISIVVVTVPFVCCSVRTALILTHTFLPFSFYSPPHSSGGSGSRAASGPIVASHSQTITKTQTKK